MRRTYGFFPFRSLSFSVLLFSLFPSFPFCPSSLSFSLFPALLSSFFSCIFFALFFAYKKLFTIVRKTSGNCLNRSKGVFYEHIYDSTHNIDPKKIVSSPQRSIAEGAFYGGRSDSENDTDGKEKELLRRSPVRTIFVCCRRYRSNIP